MPHRFDGAAARRFRKAKDWKIEKLAVEIDRSVRSVADYECGRAQPPVGAAADIAAALEVPLSELVAQC